MPAPPKTSVSLLRELAAEPQSARWAEIYVRYRPAMESFLAAHFPSVDKEDAIQETMLALFQKIPGYRIDDAPGRHFHNYLIGILKHKAMDALKKMQGEESKLRRIKIADECRHEDDEDEWKHSAMEVAIAELLADENLNARHREIFRAVALRHERPADVASKFGISRANIDQIKRRMIEKLAAIANRLVNE